MMDARAAAARLTFDKDMISEIVSLVARAVTDEREACAKVCDTYAEHLREASSNYERVITAQCAAEMIRNRSENQ